MFYPPGLPAPSNLELLCKLMEVLCAYQQVLPSALEQTWYDFTLMLPNIFTHHSTSKETDLLQQLQCDSLIFLRGFPTGRFKWFKEVRVLPHCFCLTWFDKKHSFKLLFTVVCSSCLLSIKKG